MLYRLSYALKNQDFSFRAKDLSYSEGVMPLLKKVLLYQRPATAQRVRKWNQGRNNDFPSPKIGNFHVNRQGE